MMIKRLKFQKGNSKLSKDTYTFSLPAGWTCPAANECKSQANPTTGKIKDFKATKYRCYAASNEAMLPSVRRARWYNLNTLKQCKTLSEMVETIKNSIPKKAKLIRVHVSGDFYSKTYFKAWMNVAKELPHVEFYTYTKRADLIINNSIPDNFSITISYGGKYDHLIEKHNLKYVKVVYSYKEARELKLEIDNDDSHARKEYTKSFAVLLHGSQPKGTPAAKQWEVIKRYKIAHGLTMGKDYFDKQKIIGKPFFLKRRFGTFIYSL